LATASKDSKSQITRLYLLPKPVQDLRGPYHRTNNVECQPVESFLKIDASTCTASSATNLPNEKTNIVIDERFMTAQGL
jgi:hypothetical protein